MSKKSVEFQIDEAEEKIFANVSLNVKLKRLRASGPIFQKLKK